MLCLCPPESVLLGLVGLLATDEEGIVQGLGHLVVQLVFGVQVIHTGHQLVEPLSQHQLAARRLGGISGKAV